MFRGSRIVLTPEWHAVRMARFDAKMMNHDSACVSEYLHDSKDSVRSKSGFAHTNEYPISVQSGGANDTATVPVSRQKGPRLHHRGETSSLSTAQAETPRPPDRPGEYTPHVRLYPAHTYPIQNVATALQSAHSDRRRSLRVFLGLARVPVHK